MFLFLNYMWYYHRRRGVFLYDREEAFHLSRVAISNKMRSHICLAHNSTTVMVCLRVSVKAARLKSEETCRASWQRRGTILF